MKLAGISGDGREPAAKDGRAAETGGQGMYFSLTEFGGGSRGWFGQI